jgi:hypothetical protein
MLVTILWVVIKVLATSVLALALFTFGYMVTVLLWE